jgi:hypothetical protein
VTTAKKAAAPAKKAAASAAKSDAEKTSESTTTTAAPSGPDTTPTPSDEQSTPVAPDGEQNDGTDEATTDEASTETVDNGSTDAASTAVETGPQTGKPSAPETTSRPPATIVNETPGAAPLSPPADHGTQREPALGYPSSSTDQTYAEVGGRTIAGENHVALVDRDNNPVDVSTLFREEGARFTHVVATQRVYERFTYPNSKRADKRLIFPEGALVPRAQAARIKAAAVNDAEVAAAASDSE